MERMKFPFLIRGLCDFIHTRLYNNVLEKEFCISLWAQYLNHVDGRRRPINLSHMLLNCLSVLYQSSYFLFDWCQCYLCTNFQSHRIHTISKCGEVSRISDFFRTSVVISSCRTTGIIPESIHFVRLYILLDVFSEQNIVFSLRNLMSGRVRASKSIFSFDISCWK